VKPGSKLALSRKNATPIEIDPDDTGFLPVSYFQESTIKLRTELGWGRERIWRYLSDNFGDKGFAYSDKTVESWYEGVNKGPVDQDDLFEFESVDPIDAPRIATIELVKVAVTDGQRLTIREARTAAQLKHFFEIPYREPLDVFAQYAIVDTYARRKFAGIQTSDLDALLSYQPWNPRNTELYRLALEVGKAPIPRIPRLTEYVAMDRFVPHTAIIAAYAQLRIPYLTMYRTAKGRSGQIDISRSNEIRESKVFSGTTYEDRANLHTWRDHLEARMNGVTMKIQTGFPPNLPDSRR
jgi:hypothetical protein